MTILIFQLRKLKVSQTTLLPTFMYQVTDGDAMKTQVSQLPALDSGRECSEAAQIYFHTFLLLLLSKCYSGFTLCPSNAYIRQLSP